jgi:hypothetical protein
MMNILSLNRRGLGSKYKYESIMDLIKTKKPTILLQHETRRLMKPQESAKSFGNKAKVKRIVLEGPLEDFAHCGITPSSN